MVVVLKKYLLFLLLPIFPQISFAQTILNGSFEDNLGQGSALTNSAYESLMRNSFSFGSWRGGGTHGGQMDICYTTNLCKAQNGDWSVGLCNNKNTADSISLKLCTPLIAGKKYLLSFYDKPCQANIPGNILIGISADKHNFGTLVYKALTPITDSIWTKRTFSFEAPFNAQYITITIGSNNGQTKWMLVDNFVLENIFDGLVKTPFDTTICNGATLVLNAATPNSTYQWQDNSNDSIFTVTKEGKFWVKVSNSCEIKYDSFTVKYRTLPTIDFGPDIFICRGQKLILRASNGNLGYIWNDNSTDSVYEVTKQGKYWLTVTNECGYSNDTITILQNECKPLIWIPNAFSPNGDGINDIFRIEASNVNETYLRIYNKWGEEIFRTNKVLNEEWNGEGSMDGVYFYIFYYKANDFTSRKYIKGTITLLR